MLIWIAIGVPKNMLDDHNGKILIRVLKSSTCCTEQILHFAMDPSGLKSSSVFIAARLKILHCENLID